MRRPNQTISRVDIVLGAFSAGSAVHAIYRIDSRNTPDEMLAIVLMFAACMLVNLQLPLSTRVGRPFAGLTRQQLNFIAATGMVMVAQLLLAWFVKSPSTPERVAMGLSFLTVRVSVGDCFVRRAVTDDTAEPDDDARRRMSQARA